MDSQRVLVYLLRRDLRLLDNPIFHEIAKLAQRPRPPFTHVLPLYVFAAQQIEVSGLLASADAPSPFPEARSELGGFWRCGPHRAKFLAESVWSLKGELETIGSGLVIRAGRPGQVVHEILEQFRQSQDNVTVTAVWMTGEEGVEEQREEKEVRRVAERAGIAFELWVDEKYLIDDRDLPFEDPSDLPDVFTTYRKMVEPLRAAPRDTVPAPPSFAPLPSFIPPQAPPFRIPDRYDELESALLSPLVKRPDLANPPARPAGVETSHPFHGGTAAGQARIRHLLASDAMSRYKATRNGLLGPDFSTKLSAYLALGCITARQVHAHLLDFEDGREPRYETAEGYGRGENSGTAAVRFELLWRDYMRLCTRKFGPRLFRLEGFRDQSSYRWKSPAPNPADPVRRVLDRVLRGRTGTGLIDASQRELLLTGYTSNRARQNVASYLAKHLGLNWKLGAEWYESMLIDYDVSSNWGNWQYVAGVGNDPRGEARVFNPIKQACDYDPHGAYCKAWVEELRPLEDAQEIFQVWKVRKERRAGLGLDGLDMVEDPLKKIDFKVGGKGRGGGGGGGGGRYGGSSRPRENGGWGPGRGGGHGGGRGGLRGQGKNGMH